MRALASAVVLILLALHGHAPPASAQEPIDGTEFADPLQTYWEEALGRALDHATVGYSYVIRRGGEPVAVGGRGYARAPMRSGNELGVPMTADTRIQIASCSKPITAVALLRELALRNLTPDQRFWPLIEHVFDNAGTGVKEITVEQLLTHTSGYEFGYIESPLMENARKLLAQPLPHPPDRQERYSNINSSLARIVLEVVSGRDYETYVREEILKPAGAEGMKLRVAEDEVAHSYAYNDLRQGKPIAIDFTDEAAAYGWYSTANELASVVRMIRSSGYLSEQATREMFERNLGWGARELHGLPAYGHDGQWVLEGNVGVRSGVMVLPDDVEAVLLINTNGPFFPHRILAEASAAAYPRVSHVVDGATGKAWVYVGIPANADELRWTEDGTDPTTGSRLVDGPILIDVPATFKCRGFSDGKASTFVTERRIG